MIAAGSEILGYTGAALRLLQGVHLTFASNQVLYSQNDVTHVKSLHPHPPKNLFLKLDKYLFSGY